MKDKSRNRWRKIVLFFSQSGQSGIQLAFIFFAPVSSLHLSISHWLLFISHLITKGVGAICGVIIWWRWMWRWMQGKWNLNDSGSLPHCKSGSTQCITRSAPNSVVIVKITRLSLLIVSASVENPGCQSLKHTLEQKKHSWERADWKYSICSKNYV